MQNKISILGCGWLGLPLAEALVKKNYQVAGSTTTPEKMPLLAQKNIQPFLLDLSAPEIIPETAGFFESEVLVVNVPPKRNSGNPYAVQIRKLQENLLLSEVKKVIYISSTSVYLPGPGFITEASALDEAGAKELIAAEKIISTPENPWQTTIIRFAGLFGPGRAPGRFLAGKTNLPDPLGPVNLIHQEDCIRVIEEVMAQQKWNEVYNASADIHPTREEFYVAAAHKLNLPPPTFTSENGTGNPGKLISSEKLKRDLNFTFRFPDPLQALSSC